MLQRSITTHRACRLSVAFGALLVAIGCSDQSTGTLPDGTYSVVLETPPRHKNGAALINLSGGGILEVLPDGAPVYANVHEGGARVLIVAETPGSLRFSLRLSGARTLPTASIVQVSDEQDELRPSLTGYTVEIGQ